jgi:hypothetical protein
MKKHNPIINSLLIAILLSSTLIASAILSQSCNDSPPPPRTVSFDVDEDALEGLSVREQKDQIRDWLLLTALQDAGLDAGKITKASYDLPAVRHGYLRPVTAFDYGETRSRRIADDKVLALLPAKKTDAERTAHLTRIADEHRKNTGEIPKTILVTNYEIDLPKLSATLSLFGTVNGASLFTERHKYTEAAIRSASDLEKFLKNINDLTYAEVKGGELWLGGRKLDKYPTRDLRVEDAAALWQSDKGIHDKLVAINAPAQNRVAEFNARWAQRLDEFNAKWGTITYSTPVELETKQGLRDQEWALFRKQKDQEWALIEQQLAKEDKKVLARLADEKVVSGSGFSLDPHYDHGALRSLLPRIKRALLSSSIPVSKQEINRDLQKAEADLAKQNANAFFDLIDKYVQCLPSESGKSLHEEIVERGIAWQSARYDGHLGGTEVGMTLFYTDLLAKLWAFDFEKSAPAAAISDFTPLTRVKVAPIYEAQIEALPSTRIWFGHNYKGFQVANNGASLLFARNSTRVFAASRPGVEGDPSAEVPPAANAEAFIGWWNDHYEEIAAHEPEYLRLNQIMKWSLLISWLNQAEKGDLLGFLNADAVRVDHNAWFPDWARKQEQKKLQFQQWDKTGFHPRGFRQVAGEPDVEAMRLLSSDSFEQFCQMRVLSGGVSLASRKVFEKHGNLSSIPTADKTALRSEVDLNSIKPGGQSFNTRDGVKHEFTNLSAANGQASSMPPPGVKPQSRASERAASGEYRIDVASGAGNVKLGAQFGDRGLGEFSVRKTPGGFDAEWRGGEIPKAEAIAGRMSQSPDAAGRMLALDRDVAEAVELPNGQYLVRPRGSNDWLRISPESSSSVNIPAGYQMRVGERQSGLSGMLISEMSDAQVSGELAQGKYIKLQPLGGGEPGIRVQLTNNDPSAASKPAAIEISTSGGKATLSGQIDPATGEMYVPAKGWAGDNKSIRLVDKNDLVRMGEMARGGEAVNYQRRAITPEDLAAVKQLAREGNYPDALRQLDSLSKSHGDSAALGIYRESLLLQLGRTQEAVAHAKTTKGSPDLRAVSGQIAEIYGKNWRQIARENIGEGLNFRRWREHFADPASKLKGEASPYAEQGRFLIEVRCILREWLPFGKRIATPSEIDYQRAVGYIPDAGAGAFKPGVNIQEALQQAIANPARYDIFELSQAGIDSAAPHRLVDTETGRTYRLSRAPSSSTGAGGPSPGSTTPGPQPSPGGSDGEGRRPWFRVPPQAGPTPSEEDARQTPVMQIGRKTDCRDEQTPKVYIIVEK